MNDMLEEEKDFGFARVYAVELKYRQEPSCSDRHRSGRTLLCWETEHPKVGAAGP